jgi:trimethylamine--corrinoid protein Co-methyltransferase
MRAARHAYDVLSPSELRLIHEGALRILAEMGMEVQNEALLRALGEAGLEVDLQAQRVRFPRRSVERYLAEGERNDWTQAVPQVSGSAGLYHSLYHDPASGKLVPWTEERLATYCTLARVLPGIDGVSILGCPLPVPLALAPLYERYYCWKYGAREGGSIHLDALCPYLLDLYRARADAEGVSLAHVFRATVYVVPPLKLGRHEAYQVAAFRQAGLRVRIGGGMLTMGATAPATLAGAVTLNLAEQLALRLVDWALFGERRLHLCCSVAPMDMRTAIRPFGRPEMAVANLMTAQLARHYGASFSGHAALTDAKLPSVEAGAQKATSGVATLLAGGSLWVDAGLLSIDEVCSPVQMILDHEWMRALRHLVQPFEVNDDTLGLDTILQAGPGGQYLDSLHTVRHFRHELWNPEVWSRQMLRSWASEGRRTDADRAREQALEVQEQVAQGTIEQPEMSETLEREVLRVIERAGSVLA